MKRLSTFAIYANPAPLLVSRQALFPGIIRLAEPDLYFTGGSIIVDHGHTVSESPALVGLRKDPVVLVSAADLQRIGVVNGTEVKLTTARGSVNLPIRAVRGVAAGVAVVALDNDGARSLIDTRDVVTDVRVETLR
mgnify:CR=1 FL=1